MTGIQQLNLQIIITLICWGTWGIFDKKALERASEIDVMIMLYLISMLTIPIVYLVLNTTSPGWHIAPEVMFWTSIAAVAYAVAQMTYLAALEGTEASFVLGITASYPIVAQIVASLFLNEPLVPQRVIGAVIVALGITMIGASSAPSSQSAVTSDTSHTAVTDNQEIQNLEKAVPSSKSFSKVLLFSAIATVCWGVFGFFDKKALTYGTPLEVYFTHRSWDSLILILLYLFFRLRKHKFNFKGSKTWGYCAISEALLAVGSFTYLGALAATSASYVITITGCYPLLMYLVALAFLKEKFNRIRAAGISLIVAGGIAVQLTQGM